MNRHQHIESNNTNDLEEKTRELAQGLSQAWNYLPQDDMHSMYAEDPKLGDIHRQRQNKNGKNGIQVWYEAKMKFVNSQSGTDHQLKSRLLYKLWEDLSHIAKSVNRCFETQHYNLTVNSTCQALRDRIQSLCTTKN